MSVDRATELRAIGRNLCTHPIKANEIPSRSCLIIMHPRSLLDTSAFNDAYKAAKLFIRADFHMFYLVSPTYSTFYTWFYSFLENCIEHLSVVFTGFPMKESDGGDEEAIPFLLKDREVTPSRVFSLIKKHKIEGSRLTLVINGCPAVETWSNGGTETQKISFSTTSASSKQPHVQTFKGDLPEQILLITCCPRLDCDKIEDRAAKNVSHLIKALDQVTKLDPVLDADGFISQIGPKLRQHGIETVIYSSSINVSSGTPLLL